MNTSNLPAGAGPTDRSPLDLVVLVSGSGTNLQAILDAIAAGRLSARVRLVVSNVAGAAALARAQAANVPTLVLDHRGHASREVYDAQLVASIRERAPMVLDGGWVVLAGFMRLLTKVFLDAFPGRVVNVHPSLLPSFRGLDAHGQALAAGVKVSGCTVHLVDSGTDTGPILGQAVVPVLEDDGHDALAARVLAWEHRLLPQILQWIAEGRLHHRDGRPRFEGVLPVLGLQSSPDDHPSL